MSNKYYKIFLDKKNTSNARKALIDDKEKNKKVRQIKNPKKLGIPINDYFNVEYNEEIDSRHNNPPQIKKGSRKNSIGSLRTRSNINKINSIMEKKDKGTKSPAKKAENKIYFKKNKNRKNESVKREKSKEKRIREQKTEKLSTEDNNLEKIKNEIKTELKSEIENAIISKINTSEKNIINKLDDVSTEISTEIRNELRNGFTFLGSIFNQNYENFLNEQKAKENQNININKSNLKSEENARHYRLDNKSNAKSIISYNKNFDNPLKIENFNISENSSKNDNKVIQQDSFEIISIANSLKSKKSKNNSSSDSKNGNQIPYAESSQNANSVDNSSEFQTFQKKNQNNKK